MRLVKLLRTSRAALRADFQRFYGLDLDTLGHGLSVVRASDLAAYLPPDAAIYRESNPDWQWTLENQLLPAQVDALRWLVWSKTTDGQRNRNHPKPIPRPGVKPEHRNRFEGVTVVSLDRIKELIPM